MKRRLSVVSSDESSDESNKNGDGECEFNEILPAAPDNSSTNITVKYHSRPSEQNIKLSELRKKMKEQEISYTTIFSEDFEDIDNIWFIEHIDILKNTGLNTEDYYKIKHSIYERYIELKKNKINKESLNKIKSISDVGGNTNDLVNKILNSDHNDYVKSVLYRKYEIIRNMDKADEYYKILDWIITVLDIPVKIRTLPITEAGEMIIALRDTLNKRLYGLNNVKEKIIETYCAMLNNPHYNKKFIALVGPPGVGKTVLAQSIAETIGLPYEHITFGNLKDANVLTGHSLTYVGSKAGVFVNILRKCKCKNPVILLDEVDKIKYSSDGMSINSVLLHVLDYSQNNKFQDMYLPEIHIDLSNVFFILALNDIENIDHILKDRIHIVKINGYNINEKVVIGQQYILPKILENLMFDKNDIKISEKVMTYIISKTCNSESGVRELEKTLSTICEKINVLKQLLKSNKKIKLSYNISNLKFPLEISEKIIDMLLQSY